MVWVCGHRPHVIRPKAIVLDPECDIETIKYGIGIEPRRASPKIRGVMHIAASLGARLSRGAQRPGVALSRPSQYPTCPVGSLRRVCQSWGNQRNQPRQLVSDLCFRPQGLNIKDPRRPGV